MPDGGVQGILIYVGIALLVVGVHAGVVGTKKVVKKIDHGIVHVIKHPKKDVKAIYHHETDYKLKDCSYGSVKCTEMEYGK